MLLSACAASVVDADALLPPSPRALPVYGQPVDVQQPVLSEKAGYRFLVGGHLYGDPGTLSSVPSMNFVMAIPGLRARGEHFLVSVGDLWRTFKDWFVLPTEEVLSLLEMPVYNAPGNHDYGLPDDYRSRFGSSYGCFRYRTGLFVLLNTEIEKWNIEGAQLDFFRAACRYAESSEDIEHVFFFAHKLVFAAHDERYAIVFEHMNAKDGYDGRCNFASELRPVLGELAAVKPVYWFGGDVGVRWSFGLLYDVDPRTGITFVATGTGQTTRDCLVEVVIDDAGQVAMTALPLAQSATVEAGGPTEGPVERYGLAQLRALFEQSSPETER